MINTAEAKRFIFSIYPFEKFDCENNWNDLKKEPKNTEIFKIFIVSSAIIPDIKKNDFSSSVKSKEECLNIYL